MTDLLHALQELKASLCSKVEVGGLYARSAVAHKWKAPWRALLLREAVAWRLQDLLEQSLLLGNQSKLLGARVLLRSAFETLAVLVFLNQAMRNVVAGKLSFHEFSEKTSRLLLGSRDKTTSHEAINILSILASADRRYPGLSTWYAALSESAHPNYEGLLVGYSTADHSSHTTVFQNRWAERYGKTHEAAVQACLVVFLGEYNDESAARLEALESWLEANDAQLQNAEPPRGDA